jgi:hypothetical protein
MVDLCALVEGCYYDPRMAGSNSLKKVLPAVLRRSERLRAKYSEPIYGAPGGIPSLNFEDWRWIQPDDAGEPIDPYRLLPPLFEDLDVGALDLVLEADEIADGGAAMTAYARMQFAEMTAVERSAVAGALLKYCELDTMAMVFLYEHFRELIE